MGRGWYWRVVLWKWGGCNSLQIILVWSTHLQGVGILKWIAAHVRDFLKTKNKSCNYVYRSLYFSDKNQSLNYIKINKLKRSKETATLVWLINNHLSMFSIKSPKTYQGICFEKVLLTWKDIMNISVTLVASDIWKVWHWLTLLCFCLVSVISRWPTTQNCRRRTARQSYARLRRSGRRWCTRRRCVRSRSLSWSKRSSRRNWRQVFSASFVQRDEFYRRRVWNTFF